MVALFAVVWVTAPEWERSLGPVQPQPASESFVFMNLTTWSFSGPATCWQSPVFSNGGTVLLNGTFNTSVSLVSPAGSSGPTCTAESVGTLTRGFIIQSTNAPVTVAPGGSARLFVNLTVPSEPYTGPLSMSILTRSP
ncbi:MAG: hypothetical protein L3K02_05960 [Thermoplasmata archaeon]|nr:hypothetical protein [Thermoplasmata archaeon]